MSSIKVNVRSKVRLTSTGQTTFVKKVVIGTPVRSIIEASAVFTGLEDTTITNVSEKQLIVFDSNSGKFVNTDSATLVNLTLTGKVGSHLVPTQDSTFDLGDSAFKWRDLHLSGGTIHLGGLLLKDSGTQFSVSDSAGTSVNFDLTGSTSQIRGMFSAGGDLTYNSSTGIFQFDVENVYTQANFESDLGAAIEGGTGITYDSSTDTINITNTGVSAATYGSASQVPQIAVNAQGQITSASNVNIAGVTGVTYDSSNGALTVSTSAGTSFTDSINLNPFSTSNLSEGTNQYYTTTRADSAFDARFDSSFDERLATKSTTNLSEGSNQYFTTARARSSLSGSTGITYNSSTGAISTTDGDIVHDNLSGFVANEHIDHTSVSIATGTGLSGGGTIASTRTLKIDSSDLASLYSKVIVHDNTNGFVANEHIDHSGVSIIAGKGLSGGGTIASSRTIDIDSANVRGMLSGGTGITYNSGTGAITTTDGEIVHDNLSGFVALEHVDHGNVVIHAGKGLVGGGTIAADRTIDIDSANVRGMFSGSNGISYTSGTGDIRAPQPLDSAANPTFNQLRGPAEFVIDPAAIGDATGTVKILGNLQVEGTQTTINSSTIVLKDKNIVIADSAADSSALNGAGFTWGDSAIANNPTFNYNHAEERFVANRSIGATSFVGVGTSLTALNASNISSGTISDDRLPASITSDITGNAATATSLATGRTIDVTGVTATGQSFDGTGDINIEVTAVPASLLTGTIDNARISLDAAEIPNLATSKITSGVFDSARIPTLLIDDIGNITAIDHDALTNFSASEHVDHGNVVMHAGTGLTGGGTIASDVTFNVIGGKGIIANADDIQIDSANIQSILDSNFANNDITFDSAGAIFFDKSDQALEFGDNYKATFGASGDLSIRHSGNHSIISDAGTGDLLIAGSQVRIMSSNISENMIRAITDGAVELYHDNSKKLETASGGVTVTGTVDATAFDGDGSSLTNVDAETLDGINSTSFLRSDATDTYSGGTLSIISNSSIGHYWGLGLKYDGGWRFTNDNSMGMALRNNATGGYWHMFIADSAGTADSFAGNSKLQEYRFGGTDGEYIKVGGNTVWHAGNDGTGSTLDADLLDGIQGSSFLRSDAADAFSGVLTATAPIEFNGGVTYDPSSSGAGTDTASDVAVSLGTGQRIVGHIQGYIRTLFEWNTSSAIEIGQSNTGYINHTKIYGGLNGGVELYEGANKKFETRDSGVTITGELVADSATFVNLKSTGDVTFDSAFAIMYDKSDKALEFGDNYEAVFGAGTDLRIFHDGANSNIINTTGSLIIADTNGDVKIQGKYGEQSIIANNDGSVELYYNGNKKFETRDSGVTITGELNVDSATLTNLNYQLISQGVANNSYDKIRLWSSAAYSLGMVAANTFGGLDDYAITFTMSNTDNRGFLFRDTGHTTAQGSLAITTDGELTVAKAARIGYGISDTTSPFDSNGGFTLDISGNTNLTGELSVTSTADNGPVLKLVSNDPADAADFGIEGVVQFYAENDASESTLYYSMQLQTADISDGSEDGWLYLNSRKDGTLNVANAFGADGSMYILGSGNGDEGALKWFQTRSTSHTVSVKPNTPTASRDIFLPDADGTVALQEQAYQAINAQTGTTYTTVLADGGKLVTLSNGSAITLTIPPNSSVAYPVGTKLDFIQIGAGQVTVAGGAGVTVNSTPTLKFRAQHSGASCVKIATDTWQLVGDLAAS